MNHRRMFGATGVNSVSMKFHLINDAFIYAIVRVNPSRTITRPHVTNWPRHVVCTAYVGPKYTHIPQ